jgi:C4-dicarboxylate-specific signal transduction histidine kinase
VKEATPAAIFESLETGVQPPFWMLEDSADLGTSLNASLGFDDSFCEVFTDLSDYLLEGEDVEMMAPVVTSTSAAAEPIAGPIRVRKRKVGVSNPDHNDYTIKDKKLRVSTVTSDDETEISPKLKYVERRQKNNVASKRSRETRKQKFVDMEQRANDLEKSNDALKTKIEKLEQLAKQMKEVLVKKLATK